MPDITTAEVTAANLTFDTHYNGVLSDPGDRDLLRVDLASGEWAQVTQTGTGDNALFDPLVRVYDSQGRLLTTDDEMSSSSSNLDASAIFGGGVASTYFVEAASYRDNYRGEYTVTAETIAAPQSSPVDVLDSGTRRTDRDISVYFVAAGDSASFGDTTNTEQDDVTSEGWNAYEQSRVIAALDTIAAVTNLTFNVTNNPDADFQLILDTDEFNNANRLGYFYYPSGTRASVGVFNGSSVGWNDEAGGGLDLGGLSYATLVHEFLHGLGLEHMHDGEHTLEGVHTAFGDHGVNGLNQGIYSTMSYNGGYADAPTVGYTSGNEAGPMALDIAALQALYDANTTTASGNDVYVIPETDDIAWQAIWDTGGTDTIRYDGQLDSTIDLRAATLTYDIGGGGYVSSAGGIAGGFTIAHGVTIERAIGGGGDDRLIANHAGSILEGGAGDDSIFGGIGVDRLIGGDGNDDIIAGFGHDTIMVGDGNDNVSGGAGDDDIVGGAGLDILFGGSGADIISTTDGQNILRGNSGMDQLTGGHGADDIDGGGGSDILDGAQGDDVLIGGRGGDQLNGGEGDDQINGGLGADILSGMTGADTFVFAHLTDSPASVAYRDQITDFEVEIDQIDLSLINAETEGQIFAFIGQEEFDGAGQVRFDQSGEGTLVQVDRNGDGFADMEIWLDNATGLTASDFVL